MEKQHKCTIGELDVRVRYDGETGERVLQKKVRDLRGWNGVYDEVKKKFF